MPKLGDIPFEQLAGLLGRNRFAAARQAFTRQAGLGTRITRALTVLFGHDSVSYAGDMLQFRPTPGMRRHYQSLLPEPQLSEIFDLLEAGQADAISFPGETLLAVAGRLYQAEPGELERYRQGRDLCWLRADNIPASRKKETQSLARLYLLQHPLATKPQYQRWLREIRAGLDHAAALHSFVRRETAAVTDALNALAALNGLEPSAFEQQAAQNRLYEFSRDTPFLECTLDIETDGTRLNEFCALVARQNLVIAEYTDPAQWAADIAHWPCLRLIGYNIIDHDLPRLQQLAGITITAPETQRLDLYWLYNALWPVNQYSALDDACDHYQVTITGRHTARGDAAATWQLWQQMRRQHFSALDQSQTLLQALAAIKPAFPPQLKPPKGGRPPALPQGVTLQGTLDPEAWILQHAAHTKGPLLIICSGNRAAIRRLYAGLALQQGLDPGQAGGKITFLGSGEYNLPPATEKTEPVIAACQATFAALSQRSPELISMPLPAGQYPVGNHDRATARRQITAAATRSIVLVSNPWLLDPESFAGLARGRQVIYSDQQQFDWFMGIVYARHYELSAADNAGLRRDYPHSRYNLALLDQAELKKIQALHPQLPSLDHTTLAQDFKQGRVWFLERHAGRYYLLRQPLFWHSDYARAIAPAQGVIYLNAVAEADDQARAVHSINYCVKHYRTYHSTPTLTPSPSLLQQKNESGELALLVNLYQTGLRLTPASAPEYHLYVLAAFFNLVQECYRTRHTFGRTVILCGTEHEAQVYTAYLRRQQALTGLNVYHLKDRNYEKKIRYQQHWVICTTIRQLHHISNAPIDHLLVNRVPSRAGQNTLARQREEFVAWALVNEKDTRELDFDDIFEEPLEYIRSLRYHENTISFVSLLRLFLARNRVVQMSICGNFDPAKSAAIHEQHVLDYLIQNAVMAVKTKIMPQPGINRTLEKPLLRELLGKTMLCFTPDLFARLNKKHWNHDRFRDFDSVKNFPHTQYLADPQAATFTQQDALNYIMRSFMPRPAASGAATPAARPADKDSFIIAATGKGKSLLFQIPAVMLAHNEEPQLVIIVSPLLSLMKDQILEMEKSGIHGAAAVNSSLSRGLSKVIYEMAELGLVNIIFAAPETICNNEKFRALVAGRPPALLVIDEAHCVSGWGHDFRIEYYQLAGFFNSLFLERDFPLLALTATARRTDNLEISVVHDIITMLRLDISQHDVISSTTIRPNLHYQLIKIKNTSCPEQQNDDYIDPHKLEQIRYIIADPARCFAEYGVDYPLAAKDHPKVLVYCTRKKTTEELARQLSTPTEEYPRPRQFVCFHAGLKNEKRDRILEQFKGGKCHGVVATIAFGMGVNIPDIRIVIHYDMPGSTEGYYQEAGRAGRDGKNSLCIYLHSDTDYAQKQSLVRSGRLSLAYFEDLYEYVQTQCHFKQNETILETSQSIEMALDPSERKGKQSIVKPMLFYSSREYDHQQGFLEYSKKQSEFKYILKQHTLPPKLTADDDLNRIIERVFHILEEHSQTARDRQFEAQALSQGYNKLYEAFDVESRAKFQKLMRALYELQHNGIIEIISHSYSLRSDFSPRLLKDVFSYLRKFLPDFEMIENVSPRKAQYYTCNIFSLCCPTPNETGSNQIQALVYTMLKDVIQEYKNDGLRVHRIEPSTITLRSKNIIKHESLNERIHKKVMKTEKLCDAILDTLPAQAVTLPELVTMFDKKMNITRKELNTALDIMSMFNMFDEQNYASEDVLYEIANLHGTKRENSRPEHFRSIYSKLRQTYNLADGSLWLMNDHYLRCKAAKERAEFFERYFMTSELDQELLISRDSHREQVIRVLSLYKQDPQPTVFKLFKQITTRSAHGAKQIELNANEFAALIVLLYADDVETGRQSTIKAYSIHRKTKLAGLFEKLESDGFEHSLEYFRLNENEVKTHASFELHCLHNAKRITGFYEEPGVDKNPVIEDEFNEQIEAAKFNLARLDQITGLDKLQQLFRIYQDICQRHKGFNFDVRSQLLVAQTGYLAQYNRPGQTPRGSMIRHCEYIIVDDKLAQNNEKMKYLKEYYCRSVFLHIKDYDLIPCQPADRDRIAKALHAVEQKYQVTSPEFRLAWQTALTGRK